MQEARKTLIRVTALSWILAVLVIAAGIVIAQFRPLAWKPYVLGEVLGSAVSSLLMLHRYMTLDVELDMNKKSASNHLKVMASLRVLILLAALMLSFWCSWLFYPLTTFFGLFASKAAALLYPVVFRDKKET
jgi:hypothetical protein